MDNTTDFEIDKGVLKRYTGPGGAVLIPAGVTSIRFHAFRGTAVTSVTIPEGVTTIGKKAFGECADLRSVTFPKNLKTIGPNAFSKCTSLRCVTIPEGCEKIQEHAFSFCTSLTTVSISEGVTEIGERAFASCTSLTSVTLPEGVLQIGGGCFSYCRALPSIVFPDSVAEIGIGAFWHCDALITVTFGAYRSRFNKLVFWGCKSLSAIFITDPLCLPEEYQFCAAVGFSVEQVPDGDPRYETYGPLIKDHAEQWMVQAAAIPDLINLMCRKKLIPARLATAYVNAAIKNGNAECIAMLLEYKSRIPTDDELFGTFSLPEGE